MAPTGFADKERAAALHCAVTLHAYGFLFKRILEFKGLMKASTNETRRLDVLWVRIALNVPRKVGLHEE